MGDDLKKSIDLYYEELDSAIRKHRAKLVEVKTDKNLSAIGKEKKQKELAAALKGTTEEIKHKFESDINERRSNIEATLYPKNIPRERAAEIKRRLEAGDNYIGQEGLFLALVTSIDLLREDLERSTYVSAAARLGDEDMGRLMTNAANTDDIKRLGWLKQAAELTGREQGPFVRSLDAQIESIRDRGLSQEQRRLKELGREMEKQSELFAYSLERATGDEPEYVDLREGGSSDPGNRE